MNDDLPLYVIQDYIMGQVNQRLMEALDELDLGAKVVSSLELARGAFGWRKLRGLYLLGDGRWFLARGTDLTGRSSRGARKPGGIRQRREKM